MDSPRPGIARLCLAVLLGGAALATAALAQAPAAPQTSAPAPSSAPARPTLEEVRRDMASPSREDTRGRIDSLGYAVRAEQMAKVWEVSAGTAGLDSFAPAPPPGVAAVICPHDDFSFAGRVYRRVMPLVTAKTVVLIGVFHGYRKFGEHDRLVFDSYRAWTAPDGEVPVSSLRESLLARLPHAEWVQDTAAHDAEHSLEPLVCWLRHRNADVEIVPIIVPGASFERLREIAQDLAAALSAEMQARGWALGRDLAIAISTDGVHYGPDFNQTLFGEGGVDAYEKATAKDRELMLSLGGPLTVPGIRALFETFVDPQHPDTYRWTWCGRLAIPLGLLTLENLTRENGGAIGHPLVYATSISGPELPLREAGMQPTSPANLYHFVGYPSAAFTRAQARE